MGEQKYDEFQMKISQWLDSDDWETLGLSRKNTLIHVNTAYIGCRYWQQMMT